MTFIYILATTLVISLLSLIGILSLVIFKKHFHEGLLTLVALSAGAMLGNAFFHLLPEALELTESGPVDVFGVMLLVVGSFVVSFLFEQFFSWHHCHNAETCEVAEKPYAHLVLYSDGLHNFIDGLVIAAAYMVTPALGLSTAVAIALHEVPQELGDYAVLVHGGFSKARAALLNWFSSLGVVAGGVAGYFLVGQVEWAVPVLLPIAAGGFLYIAAADLLPELKHSENPTKIPLHILVFLTGLAIMIVSALI